MRRLLLTAALVVAPVLLLTAAFVSAPARAQESLPGDAPQFKDLRDKVSYIIGLNIAQQIRTDKMDLDPALLTRGLQDGMSGAKPVLSEEDIQKSLTEFQQKMQAEDNKRLAENAQKNKDEGEAFLAANKQKDGVVALPSGLQYKVLKQGTGPSPKPGEAVTVNYKGTLINGTEFDSSYKRGQPATLELGRVIPGWSEALQHMKVGDKWELYIPANLAYGVRGAGVDIGPNATLIFDVELLDVKPAGQQ